MNFYTVSMVQLWKTAMRCGAPVSLRARNSEHRDAPGRIGAQWLPGAAPPPARCPGRRLS